MYEIKYKDLKGKIINESEVLEEENYYKIYYDDNIVVKEEIVKNKKILNIHYFHIGKDDLCECILQHMDKYNDVSACFHNKLEKENEDCYKERMYLYSDGKINKIEDDYSDAEGNQMRNITYKIEGDKLIPVFEIEYFFDEYGDIVEKCKKY